MVTCIFEAPGMTFPTRPVLACQRFEAYVHSVSGSMESAQPALRSHGENSHVILEGTTRQKARAVANVLNAVCQKKATRHLRHSTPYRPVHENRQRTRRNRSRLSSWSLDPKRSARMSLIDLDGSAGGATRPPSKTAPRRR